MACGVRECHGKAALRLRGRLEIDWQRTPAAGAGGGTERAKNLRGAVGGARRPAAGAGLLSWLAA